jgi:HlyD family secretion protein
LKTRKILLWLLALALLTGLVAWALRPQPVSVEVAEIGRGLFEQTVDDDGRTRVRDRYTVTAPLSGRVLRIPHRAGDVVERDAVVAVLLPSVPVLQDDRTVQQLQERAGAAQAAVMRAAALEERAKASREQAQADAARSARLAAEGFLSPSSREQSESTARMRDKELEAARFERIAAERELAQARAALARFRGDATLGGAPVQTFDVRAPISGRVLRVLQESEGPVALGAELLELGDIGKLEVVVDVLSTEAVGIPAGADVYIDVGPGRAVVRGRVRRIEPSAFTKVSALGVEEQRVNVVIDLPAGGDEIDALGDGYRVDARIVVHRAQDAVLVPTGALFRDGQAYAVFVVEDGIAKKRVLEVPRRNDRTALVLGGLQPGEQVIVFPGDTVRDGVRVAVR